MINITDDNQIEGDEIIELHLNSPSTGTIGYDSVMTILLKDNDGLGISVAPIKEFSVYPNPAAQNAVLKFAAIPAEANTFELLNLMGQTCARINLKQTKQIILQDEKFKEGIYIYVCKDSSNQILKSGKLIIK